MIENWALWRDAGDWDRFATVWHDDGWMTATWFQGPAREFIAVSREGFERGVSILHFLGGFTCDIAGDRAIAQTKMTINQRATVDGVLVDVVCTGRFYDFLENGARAAGASCGGSRSTRRTGWIRSIRPRALTLDPARLAMFPEGYRHLGYLQSKIGFTVEDRPARPARRGGADSSTPRAPPGSPDRRRPAQPSIEIHHMQTRTDSVPSTSPRSASAA